MDGVSLEIAMGVLDLRLARRTRQTMSLNNFNSTCRNGANTAIDIVAATGRTTVPRRKVGAGKLDELVVLGEGEEEKKGTRK
jgi:hypothetical protein